MRFPEKFSRVGFYLDPQLPWLGIDIDAKYFSGAAKTAYKWDSNTSGISSSTGKMLKYTITYKNLSQELLETTTYNRKGAESDKLSEPTVSLALPYLESLSADNFQYVNYQDDSNGSIDGYFRRAITIPDCGKEQRQPSGNASKESG